MTVSEKKEIFWPFLIVGFGSIVCFVLLVWPLLGKPMMSEGNTYSRLQTIVMEINFPNYMTDFSWLPFYNKIMMWPLKWNFDPSALSVRYLTLLITCLTSGLVGVLTYQLTRLKSLSVVAGSLYLINPLTISLSTLTLSENLWAFLVILSVVSLMGKNKKYWILGMLMWMISQGVRYESWYLTPILMFIVWMRHKNIKLLISVFLSSLVFPFYWMMESYKYTGVYLNIINIKKYYAANGPGDIYGNLWASVIVWLERVEEVISWPFILIFVVGINQSIRKMIWLWLMPVVSIILLIIQVFSGTMEYFPARYLVILPIIVYPLVLMTLKKIYLTNSVFFLMIIVFLFIFEFISFTPRIGLISEMPNKDAIAVAEFVKQNNDNKKIIRYVTEDIKDTTWTYSTVWYFSQIPLSNFLLVEKKNYIDNVEQKNDLITVFEKGNDGKLDNVYVKKGKKIVYENEFYTVFDN
ncbi:MAG: hypothetical protein WC503_03695 [Candidatus Shapirobacteria bacterium]